MTTPVAQAANWEQRLVREIAAERRWRQKELDKQRREKQQQQQQQQPQQHSEVSPAAATTTPTKQRDSASRTLQQQQRDEIAEQSLARFPPRRDRTKLQALDRDRCCSLPQLPKHLLSRKAEHEFAAQQHNASSSSSAALAHDHYHYHHHERPIDADAFRSTKQLEQSAAVASSSATQAAVMQTSQRSGVGCTNFGRKPMIKGSFFRKFGGTNLVSDLDA